MENTFNLKQFLAEGRLLENDLSEVEGNNTNRILELIEMYVDNYFDEGITAEAALTKIDNILQGNLDDYDKAFLKGEEDNY